METISKQLYTQLPKLYIFRLVEELGSFQAAAKRLELPRSSVSKKIRQLEAALGQRLFQRSTRHLRLTEEGIALLESTNQLDMVLQNTYKALEAQQAETTGRVKVSSSTLIGQRYLLPQIQAFNAEFPKVVVELSLSDDVVDLVAEGFDLAIRVGDLPDSSLVAKQIGEKSWASFASPKYLSAHGKPVHPSDLAHHRCLIFKNTHFDQRQWSFADSTGAVVQIDIDECFSADDGRSVVDMAVLGQGIVRVDPVLVQEEIDSGALVPVLSAWANLHSSVIHLVGLQKHKRNRAVQALWLFLSDHMRVRL